MWLYYKNSFQDLVLSLKNTAAYILYSIPLFHMYAFINVDFIQFFSHHILSPISKKHGGICSSLTV